MSILVIDVANVMGSRPDGWWRDRAGAAARLRDQIAAADIAADEVVLVVEGAARSGVRASSEGRLRTVHAAGSGDDAIVDVVRAVVAAGDGSSDGNDVIVVTSDRGLRVRVEALGAATRGAGWLLDRL